MIKIFQESWRVITVLPEQSTEEMSANISITLISNFAGKSDIL